MLTLILTSFDRVHRYSLQDAAASGGVVQTWTLRASLAKSTGE
jgi:hypothetical protein